MLLQLSAAARDVPLGVETGNGGTVFVVIFAVLVIGAAACGIVFLRKSLHERSLIRGGAYTNVTMRITIPKFRSEEDVRKDENAQGVKEAIAIAETFFAGLGGLHATHGLKAWLFGHSDDVALEIVAHERLVTFYVTVPKKLQEFVEQQLHAQYSDAHVEPVVDYNMFHPTGVVVGGYLTFKRDSVFPMKTYKELDTDPLNALTNALSKVGDGDGVAIQYIVRAAHHTWRNVGLQIAKHMHSGMSLEEAMKGNKTLGTWFSTKEDVEKKKQEQRERKMSQAEQKMVEGIENKVSKAGLEANIRIIASAKTADAATMYLNNVLQAFGQYNIYEFGNSLIKTIPLRRKKMVKGFVHRIVDDQYKIVLNTEELASLWHLPLPTTETPNIRWMLARTAPAPTNVPTEGLLLGYNVFRGRRVDIYMKDGDRRRHMYIMGKTGTGKSEFIKNLAVQDLNSGKGVCVIDPHGDLADGLLELVPKDRYDDVVYFNPSDTERPMGLNMLEATPDQRDFAIQEMISVFYMLFPPEMIGPMFEHSMRNFMATLMADPEHPGTIVEIPRMIADERFQREWIARVTDPVVRSFWEDEQAKTSDYHKSEMMGYLVSKVGRFVENEMMRNIIGQAKSAFNFREIMDEGKILLVNLSKGKTGEVNANLLGLILVAKLQMAAFTRADIPEEQRRDFYLYIDEFQNFITPSIATILSEARKYKLNLVMAHQYMGQLVKDGKSEIRDAVLGNVGTIITSRIGPEDTEVLGKIYEPTFSPYDLMNNQALTWNAKIIIDNAQAKPFTLTVNPKQVGKPKVGAALKEISRLLYGRDKSIVEREIAIRAGLGVKQPVKPEMPVPPISL